MATKKFKCTVCGYVHEGDKAPDVCPVCKAPASKFEEIKKERNTNNNSYTVIYAAVMVIIVAFLLVFVSSSLKEKQTANVIQDTQNQILSSLNIRDSKDVKATYEQTIKHDYLLQADGSLVDNTEAFSTSYKTEFKAGRFHVFEADVNGETKYIIPMNGLGLWGAIWGYISLNEDRSTIYGVYFSHASETPGLGGEIASLNFQERFPGKKLTQDGQVALTITKFGLASGNDIEVDGVSGATITSKGVNSMIGTVMAEYLTFFNAANKTVTVEECNLPTDSVVVSENIEEN